LPTRLKGWQKGTEDGRFKIHIASVETVDFASGGLEGGKGAENAKGIASGVRGTMGEASNAFWQ
jgi:hypothetical protein